MTGDWITDQQATDPAYWGQHLRQPVRFAAGLEKLFEKPAAVLIEVGSGRVLSGLASQHPAKSPDHKFVSSLRPRQDTSPDDRFLLASLGELWKSGVAVDWAAFHANERRLRVPLPTYPFERKRFWMDAPKHASRGPREIDATSPEADSEIAFYRPAWKKSELRPAPSLDTQRPWLIFRDDSGVGSAVAAELTRQGQVVITVTPATAFRKLDQHRYRLRAGQRADYDELLADLLHSGQVPGQVLHLWPLMAGDDMDLCFYSLLFWAQSIGDQDLAQPIRLAVASSHLQQVAGEPIPRPEKAVLAGPCRVIPKEFPNVRCQWIDLALPAAPSLPFQQQAARTLIAELKSEAADAAVAYRQDGRWVQYAETVAVDPGPSTTSIRRNGAYLITGGLGGVGLHFAEHLARTAQAKLILMARTELPEKSEWQTWLSTHDALDPVATKIRGLQRLEALGAEVLIAAGDICNPADAKRVVREGVQKFGAIHGVIHAAGVLDDGLIQLKAKERAGRVLGPKVTGTLALEAALEDLELDFFVLCSSISSWLAPVGQVDYVAANAFLDAFALSRSQKSGRRVIAIDWGRWQNVGMTAEPAPASGGVQTGSTPRRSAQQHPFLGRSIVDSPQTTLYRTDLRLEEQWILSEHTFRGGDGLFPGTGYVEMAQALMLRHSGPGVVQVQDLAFLKPIWVGAGQSKIIQIGLKKDGESYSFQVTSNPDLRGAPEATPLEHVSATVRHLGAAAPEYYDLPGVLNRCQQRELDLEPERTNKKQSKFIDFGPRFRCLKRIYFGEDEAVSFAELDERFSADFDEFHTHPALLDTAATGSAMFIIRGYEQTQNLYIPSSYKKITLFAPLPRRFYCHIRSKPENTIQREVASFDITVVDETGRRLAEIEEFAIRRITDTAVLLSRPARMKRPAGNGQPATGDLKALEPAQALRALDLILKAGPELGSLVIVAPASLRLEEGTAEPRPRPAISASEAPRPAASSAANSGAPGEVELRLKEWLGDSLGVAEISLEDDFFDMGGDSLLAVRLFAKIKKTFGVELGLAKLFEARTVGALASLIRQSDSATAYSCIVPIRNGGNKTPLFLIHGAGGNVLGFESLAKCLDPDRPIYAMQSQALDRKGPGLVRAEDQASLYVRELRSRQPHGPYCLLGYSLGGIVAFEMAQQLSAAGERVALLGILDLLLNRRLPMRKRILRFLQVAKGDLAITFGEKGGFAFLIRRIRAKAVRIAYRLFSAAGRPAPHSLGTAFDINWFAAVKYEPRAYPGRLILFRTNDEASQWDEELGWGGLASEGIEIHKLPGNHIEVFQGANVGILAELVEKCMDDALQVDAAGAAVPMAGNSRTVAL